MKSLRFVDFCLFVRLLLLQAKVEAEVAKAFKVWSDHTPLTFTLKRSGSVHIEIMFVKGEHGDGDPFQGAGLYSLNKKIPVDLNELSSVQRSVFFRIYFYF